MTKATETKIANAVASTIFLVADSERVHASLVAAANRGDNWRAELRQWVANDRYDYDCQIDERNAEILEAVEAE